jgi:hypothetical protein
LPIRWVSHVMRFLTKYFGWGQGRLERDAYHQYTMNLIQRASQLPAELFELNEDAEHIPEVERPQAQPTQLQAAPKGKGKKKTKRTPTKRR